MKESLLIIPDLCDSFGTNPLCSSLPNKWCSHVMVLFIIMPRSRSLVLSTISCPATLFLEISFDFLNSFVPIIKSLVLDPLQTSLLSLTQEVDLSASLWSWSGLESLTLSVSSSAYRTLIPASFLFSLVGSSGMSSLMSGKSLYKIKNSMGPRRLPWGTPCSPTSLGSLSLDLLPILKIRFEPCNGCFWEVVESELV